MAQNLYKKFSNQKSIIPKIFKNHSIFQSQVNKKINKFSLIANVNCLTISELLSKKLLISINFAIKTIKLIVSYEVTNAQNSKIVHFLIIFPLHTVFCGTSKCCFFIVFFKLLIAKVNTSKCKQLTRAKKITPSSRSVLATNASRRLVFIIMKYKFL